VCTQTFEVGDLNRSGERIERLSNDRSTQINLAFQLQQKWVVILVLASQ